MPIDTAAAHRFFSADCFNLAWSLIDKPSRDADESETMIHLAHASLWHWMQRPDCKAANLSIGYWQLSRVYALVGDAGSANRFASQCLALSRELGPFLYGYAHEAMARAMRLAGDEAAMKRMAAEGRRLAEQVTDAEDRKMLLADLSSLSPG